MVGIKARGEFVGLTDQINLTVQFKDQLGNFIDTDSFPKISIVQPNGLLLLAPTSVGVTQISTGKYSYIYTVPIGADLGVYSDTWLGYINGFRVESSFSFVVSQTQMPAVNSDGYLALGDDPGFNYSQTAIANINKLLKSLRARLNSDGKSKAKDIYGNTIYVSCSIFSIDVLVTFLSTALWEFNQVPYFTQFTFDDDDFIRQFGEVLVEYATLQALASKALIEKGREVNIADNGISFTPPGVGDMLNTQYGSLISNYWERIKMIKASLRPSPKGLGVFSMTNSTINPAIKRLSHLRARRIV